MNVVVRSFTSTLATAQRHGVRGCGRLLTTAAVHTRDLQEFRAMMDDGRAIYLDLRETMCMPYFFLKRIQYEMGETQIVRRLLRAGDTAIDIGANVGWYSTLMSWQVGPTGRVVALEPNQAIIPNLVRTSQDYPNLEVINAAASDFNGEAVLNIPLHSEGWYASLSNFEVNGPCRKQNCVVTTLDELCGTRDISNIALIKCDVEGNELKVLAGARSLLNSERPPMWMIEMNPKERFGTYDPQQIVSLFNHAPGAYSAFRMDAKTAILWPLPAAMTFHFNALFVPECYQSRLAGLIED